MAASTESRDRESAAKQLDEREPLFRRVWLDLSRILAALWMGLRFGLFPFAKYIAIVPAWRLELAVRIRRAIEELGLTYLKLGQYLAIRYDVLPPAVCRELGKLFERVPPLTFETARAVIEDEFDRPLNELFSQFAQEPVAAASVAQVHEAHTKEGERVAVKVQRPGLRPIFLADIRNIKRAATLIDRLGFFGNLSARGMVGQFEQWTLRELDFTEEANTADRVGRESPPYVHVPRVYWQLTTPRVLTMEFVTGISVSEAGHMIDDGKMDDLKSRLKNFELQTALKNFVNAALTQLFVNGFFHADAHPGNLLFGDDNVIVFLDFGIFGELTEAERKVAAGQIETLALGNIQESYRYYTKQLIETESTDAVTVREKCVETLQRWYDSCMDPRIPIEQRHTSRYIGEMIEISRQNGLRFGLNYLLFWRSINALNTSIWHVDQSFDVLAEMRVFFEERMPGISDRALDVVFDRGWKTNVLNLTRSLPDRVNSGLENLSKTNFSWQVTVSDSKQQNRVLKSEAWWLTAAIVFLSLSIWMSNQQIDLLFRGSVAGSVAALLAIAKWRYK